MKKGWTAGCAFAIGMGAASFSFGADGEFGLGTGVNYSAGKYGTGAETKILSVPFIARYDTDLWVFKLTVPYLRVTSPNNVIPGVGRFDTSGARRRRAAGTTTASGLGDTTASATYTAWYDEDKERGLTVILAHPERCRAIQDEPELADWFAERGLVPQKADILKAYDPSFADYANAVLGPYQPVANPRHRAVGGSGDRGPARRPRDRAQPRLR